MARSENWMGSSTMVAPKLAIWYAISIWKP